MSDILVLTAVEIWFCGGPLTTLWALAGMVVLIAGVAILKICLANILN